MFERLTPREFKVARMLATHQSASRIAAELGVSRNAVLLTARRIRRKTALGSHGEIASQFVDLQGHDCEEATLP